MTDSENNSAGAQPPQPAGGAAEPVAQQGESGERPGSGPGEQLRGALKSGSKSGLRSEDIADIGAGSASSAEDVVRRQLEAGGDVDLDESLNQVEELRGRADKLRTRIQDITNSELRDVGCSTTIIINEAAPRGSPADGSNASGVPAAKDLPWPSCAYAACGQSIDQAAFLLSASVFDGFPIAVARAAAERLASRLRSEVKVSPDAPPAEPRIQLLDVLFEQFRIKIQSEQQKQTGLTADCLRFDTPADAASILIYGWTRIAGFPNWNEHVNSWLEELGASESRPTRLAAGTAAGLLWAKGDEAIDARLHTAWYKADSTAPLDSLDASYAAAAVANPDLRHKIAKRLWGWGNISEGVDGTFALRHLSTRLYGQIDPDACFLGLGALLERNNMLGLLQAQAAFERLFVASIESPDTLSRISRTLIDVLNRARKLEKREQRKAVMLQISLVVLSFLLAKRKDKSQAYAEAFHVIDRVLEANPASRQDFARLINAAMTGSPFQSDIIRALRAMFMRNVRKSTSGSVDRNAALGFFVDLYQTGRPDERDRLDYYLEDWTSAAADISEHVGRAAYDIQLTIRG